MLRRKILALALLAVGSLTLSAGAMLHPPQKAATRPLRLLVKFKTPPTGSNTLAPFSTRHHLRKIEPLYSDWAAHKQRSGKNARDLAEDIRNRFPERARRFRGTFLTPHFDQHYRVTPDVKNQTELDAVAQALKQDPQIEAVEQERVYQIQLTPNDPYYASQGSWGRTYADLWGLKKMSLGTAWDLTAGNGILVAVVDTGIDYTHPDLAANVWTDSTDGSHGHNFVNFTNDPRDDQGHGTHVAGTIAAVGNNSLGVLGVAWRAQVMGVKGLDSTGNGTTSELAQAIQWSVDHGAQVINMSWGNPGTSDPFLDPALAYAYQQGVVLVAAAGNNAGDSTQFYPANSPYVIAVAASDPSDQSASFSNFGSNIDVAAPGVDILSLQAAGTTIGPIVSPGYTYISGTSMAAPHVSGLAALLLSQHPAYSQEQIRSVIRHSADDAGAAGFDVHFGYGRINAQKALSATNALETKIESPVNGTSIASPQSIIGVAQGPNFSSYTLEYGASDAPTAWTLITHSNTAANHTALGSFDPRALPDGTYTIRLTVADTLGNVFTDQIQLVVNFVSISSPVPPTTPNTALTFKPSIPVSISGQATGASFQNYRVEWAQGIDPTTGWSNAGITLTQGGLSPISNGVLAAWDTSSMTQADYFTLRLTVQDQGFTSIATTLIYLEPDLASANWPQWLPGAPAGDSSVLPAFDANNQIRLVLQTPAYFGNPEPAGLWSFSYDGSSRDNVRLGQGSFHQPAIGHMNGGAGDEIVVGEGGSVSVIRPDHSVSHVTPPTNSDFYNYQPLIQDLNGDGSPEILTMGGVFANNTSALFAWKADGTLLNGHFPLPIAGLNAGLNQVLAADLAGTGSKNILVASVNTTAPSFTLKCFNADGTPKAGWPEFTAAGTFIQMAAGNLEQDGRRDIVLVYLDTQSPAHNHLVVLMPDGSIKPGWPVTINTLWLGRIAIADMDNDGKQDIVFVSLNTLHVLKSNGTPLSSHWPQVIPAFGKQFGPFAVGDIDGDGLPEIVTSSLISVNASSFGAGPRPSRVQAVQSSGSGPRQIQITSQGPQVQQTSGLNYFVNNLEAYKNDGTLTKSWRIPGVQGHQSYYYATPLIGDFNQDGKTDIAVNYSIVSGNGGDISGFLSEGGLLVLSLNTTFNPHSEAWPMNLHDPQDTATQGATAPTTSACDVNSDSATNVNDVQLCVNQAIGILACTTGDIKHDGSCNVIDVQRDVNAALGGQCVTQ